MRKWDGIVDYLLVTSNIQIKGAEVELSFIRWIFLPKTKKKSSGNISRKHSFPDHFLKWALRHENWVSLLELGSGFWKKSY